MVSDAVGLVSGAVGLGGVGSVSGAVGAVSVRMCTRFRVLSVLAGCRVVGFRVLSGGVGLSGLCRGEQPYFVVSACIKV